MHEVDRDRVRMVLGLFAEAVAQPGKALHRHTHRQILPLNVARRDMALVRIALTAERLCALDLRRAIAACGMRNFAIHLDELGVIDVRAKTALNCVEIGAMAVAGDLHTVRKPLG